MLSAAVSGVRCLASIYNYPAGHALWALGLAIAGHGAPGAAIYPVVPNPLGVGTLFNMTRVLPLPIEAVGIKDALVSFRKPGTECSIHVDAHSAMSGISRFVHPPEALCRISKEEFEASDKAALAAKLKRFDFLVSGEASVEGFDVVMVSYGFQGFGLSELRSGRVP